MADKEVTFRLVAAVEDAIAGLNKVLQAAREDAKSIRDLGKDGADTGAILDKLGRSGNEEIAKIAQAAKDSGRAIADIQGELGLMNKDIMTRARESVTALKEQSAALQVIGEKIQAVAQRTGEWTKELLKAGQEMGALQREMKIAFKDENAADGAVKAIRNLDDETGITEQSLGQAAKTLQRFGQYSDDNLQRAAIAARNTGKSIEEVSEALGKYLKYGDARSERAIKQLGIDPAEVKKGVDALVEQGVVMKGTVEYAEALKKAMLEAFDAKFGKTTDGLTSDLTRLKGEVGDLTQEIGHSLSSALNTAAGYALPFAQTVHGMGEGMKATIGFGVAATSMLASFAGNALMTAASLRMLGVTWGGVTAAISAFGAKLLSGAQGLATFIGMGGAAVIAVGALGVATYAYTQQLDANARMQGELQNRSEGAYGSLHKFMGLVGLTVDQLHEMGKSSKDVAQAILVLQEAMANKRDKGEDTSAEQQKLAALRKLSTAAAESEGAQRQATAERHSAEQASYEHSLEAFNNFQTRKSAGVYATKRDELKALEDVQARLKDVNAEKLAAAGIDEATSKKILDAKNKAEMEHVRLAREAQKEWNDGQKKGVDDALKAALTALEIEEARRGLSHRQRIARLREIQQIQGLTEEQLLDIEKRVAGEQGKIREEAAKKREEAHKKGIEAAKKRADAEREIEVELGKLAGDETQTKTAEITKQVAKYREAGASEIEIAKYVAAMKGRLEEDVAKKKHEAAKTIAGLREDAMKTEEQQLRQRVQKGQGGDAELEASIKARYALERQQIEASRAEEQKKAGDKATGDEIIRLRMEKLGRDEQHDIQDVASARLDYLNQFKGKLDAIDQKQKEMAGLSRGAQSVEEAFKGGKNLGFSLDGAGPAGGGGGEQPALPGGLTKEDLAFLSDPNVKPDDPRVAAAYAKAKGAGGGLPTSPSTAKSPGLIDNATAAAAAAAGGKPAGAQGAPGQTAAADAGGGADTVHVTAKNVYITAENVHGADGGSSPGDQRFSGIRLMSDIQKLSD